MNAIADPAATQALAAAEAMSPAPGLALVPADELRAHYAGIVASHGAERARERRRELGRWGMVGVLGASTLALSAAIVLLVPLKRVVPVFVAAHEDGSFTTTIAQSDIDPGTRERVLKATLWLYVVSRERFNTATHAEDQQAVYVLSDKPTGDTYQASVDPANKQSPWKRYGTRTTVRLHRVSEGLACGTEACAPGQTPNSYLVRYRRVEQTEGQRPVETSWASAARFRLLSDVPASQTVTINPIGVQVVQYDKTEEGSLP